MASSIPFPVLFLLATAIESLAITQAVPHEYLPEPPLSRVFVRLLVLQMVGFGVYKCLIYPFLLSPLRSLPKAPGERPILGNGLATFERPAGTSFLKWMTEIPNDGLIHFRGFFHQDRLLVTDLKALSEILVTRSYDFEKPKRLRDFLRFVLGDGLILVEGDVHKFQRKNIMPVFTFRHIKDLYPIFWQKATQLTQGVNQQVDENPENNSSDVTSVVEINHWANQVTMDIIGMAAMGRDFQALKNGQDPLIVNYEELLEPSKEKQIYFLLNLLFPQSLIRWLPWKINGEMKRIVENVQRISLELVRDKKEMVKTEPESQKDLLSLLIRSNNFSDQQLVDQMMTFLAAGHETTSSAFTWATFLLATHAEIQKALRKEIQENMPSPNTQPPADFDLATVLESLPLLNGVCNEVIRLYPTVPTTVRDAVKDTQLAGVHIPNGTQIVLSPWGINRNPHFWGKNAEEFVPERWIDTDEKTGERKPNNAGGAPNNYAILTFLHGPRSCIGQGFAKAELRCLVAAFVGSFQMDLADPNEKVIPSGVVTTKPKNGMHLRLKHLGGW
ncbi:cytochrome P450 [Lecanosticta acicola]|uniref:Cytochrome P450 n=1 Tax=Lecanosticta acicola TaxID=111012 RepID=A0AAI9EAA3_9PEZI|nr:cytochrome P450 [Lecanosticta acicola]